MPHHSVLLGELVAADPFAVLVAFVLWHHNHNALHASGRSVHDVVSGEVGILLPVRGHRMPASHTASHASSHSAPYATHHSWGHRGSFQLCRGLRVVMGSTEEGLVLPSAPQGLPDTAPHGAAGDCASC